jgi:hypothetical protein
VRPPLQLNAVRPVSDHAEHRVDAAVAELLERDQHVVGAFHRVMRPIQPTANRSSEMPR